MCGPQARTNFPYNPNVAHSSTSKLLSATLTAKLHRCYMASLQLTKSSPAVQPEPRRPAASPASSSSGSHETPFKFGGDPVESSPDQKRQNVPSIQEIKAEEGTHYQYHHQPQQFSFNFEPLKDDHIEQMIQELLDYGSIELSSSVASWLGFKRVLESSLSSTIFFTWPFSEQVLCFPNSGSSFPRRVGSQFLLGWICWRWYITYMYIQLYYDYDPFIIVIVS